MRPGPRRARSDTLARAFVDRDVVVDVTAAQVEVFDHLAIVDLGVVVEDDPAVQGEAHAVPPQHGPQLAEVDRKIHQSKDRGGRVEPGPAAVPEGFGAAARGPADAAVTGATEEARRARYFALQRPRRMVHEHPVTRSACRVRLDDSGRHAPVGTRPGLMPSSDLRCEDRAPVGSSYQRQQRALHLLKLIAQGEQDHRAVRRHDQASVDELVSSRLAERRGAS